ncbi:MAG: hypothetical protein N2594_07685 [Clostridiales bacterium]|nr:hypothetical protein [Clostridiales bacterium]
MLNRKIYLTLGIILLTVASFFTGYFTMQNFVSNKEKKDGVTAKTTVNVPTALINDNTEIIKRTKYLKGRGFVLEEKIKPNDETRGLDKTQAEKYFARQGYKVDTFTSEKVEISKEIDNQWPPNVYLALEYSGKIGIFKTNENGSLQLVEETDVELENLPEQEKVNIKEGIIKQSYEEIKALVNEDFDS